jgi:arylsulfatase A-like enzyme
VLNVKSIRLVLLALVLGCVALVTAAAERAPDVLVILTDQWNPRYLSWDDPQVRTPNLDAIAREGMIFDACYTTSPVCVPARVSLITGLYSHNAGHSVWGNVLNYYVPPEAAPMFRDIQRAGYTTSQIGKLHWTSGPAWHREFKTMDDYYRALGLDFTVSGNGPLDNAADDSAYAQYLRKLGVFETVAADMRARYIKSQYEPRASLVKPEDYHDSFHTGVAVDFIGRQAKDKPLCVVVSLHSPHPPFDAPGEFATMFEPEKLTLPGNVPESMKREGQTIDRAELRRMLANYLGKIALVDQCVGRLVAAMKARGTWDNTLVLFTADHGEMMGAHGMMSKGRFYEESARVPLVVRWPGHVKTGRTKALAQMADVYPTIVEAIGGELSPGRFAKSLLPVATGKAAAVRDVAISEIGAIAPLNMMARDARYKWWAEGEREFLFDLESDPLELRNLAGEPAQRDTLSRMRGLMLTELRTQQLNLSAGYVPKVERLRAEEKAQGEGAESAAPVAPKKKKRK